MNLRIRKAYYLYLIGSIILLGTVIAVQHTGLCRLQEVNIAPDRFAKKASVMQTSFGNRLFSIPFDEAADNLLRDKKIFRVDMDYNLPDGLEITINDIEPVALVIGNDGTSVYQLTGNYRLLPVDSPLVQIDIPVVTGYGKSRAYSKTDDARLMLVTDQLKKIKYDYGDIGLAISNIDLSHPDYISVFIDGLPFRVETYAGRLYESIISLELFLANYQADLNDIKLLNVKLKDMIIAVS